MKHMLASLLIIFWLVACNTNDNRKIDELNRNIDKWQSFAITDYQLTTRKVCFCLITEPVVVIVKDSQVEEAFFAISGEYLTEEEMSEARTIDTHFALARNAIINADRVTVEYDPVYGFPTVIDADFYEDAVDDEITYTINDFQ